MPAPALSPEEDALLRFGVTQAWVYSKGVHKTQFDRTLQGESGDILHKLVERGFLRRASTAEFLPTVHGQRYMPALSLANDGLVGLFDFGKRLLNSDNPNKTVEVDDLAKAVAHEMVSSLEDPRIRFWFDCSLFGLEPYINVVRASPEGRPLAVHFAPGLLSLRTADDLLAKVDANRRTVEQQAATKPTTLPDKNQSSPPPPQTIININAPVGALQTGDGTTANVTQHVSFDATEVLKLIEAIRAAVPAERRDVRAALEEVTVEVQSPAPEHARLRTSMGRLWRFATDVSTMGPFVIQLARILGVQLPGAP